jgi:hypothetical protein
MKAYQTVSVRTRPSREAPYATEALWGVAEAYCSGRVYGVAGRNEPALAHW